MVRLFSLRPFLLSLLWLVMSTRIQADETVTKTVVLVQATNGFVSLTGTAASAALHTLASGNLAGTIGDDSPQDGLGVPAGGVGSLHTGDGGEGKDSGSYSISIGAIAGIAVGVGLLVIGIFVMWILWFLKKKRGWEIRKSVSRASRRLTGRFNDRRSRRASMRQGVRMQSPPQNRSRERDVEKGAKVVVESPPSSTAKKDRGGASVAAPGRSEASNAPRATTGERGPPKSGLEAGTSVGKSFRAKFTQ